MVDLHAVAAWLHEFCTSLEEAGFEKADAMWITTEVAKANIELPELSE